jgi:hypothetical protein
MQAVFDGIYLATQECAVDDYWERLRRDVNGARARSNFWKSVLRRGTGIHTLAKSHERAEH